MLIQTRRNFVISAAAAGAAFGLDRQIEFIAPAQAQKAPGAASFKRFMVGDVEVTQMFDGHWEKPHDAGFIKNASIDDTKAALKAAGLTTDHVPITFTVTLVKIKDKYVMFDSGTGGQLSPKAGLMMKESMAAAGIDPAKISTILVTHYHADHIFGLMAKDTNAQMFPAAEIIVPEVEHKWWNDASVFTKLPEARHGLAKRIQATMGTWKNVRPMAAGSKEAVAGIQPVALPGHTPGHTGYAIGSGAAQLLVLSDTANIPALFVKNPGWHAAFDGDANLAEKNRRAVFDRAVADKAIVTGYHFGLPGAGTIAKDGTGYAFVPVA